MCFGCVVCVQRCESPGYGGTHAMQVRGFAVLTYAVTDAYNVLLPSSGEG